MKKIMKAFTLSYDDGIESDLKFIELLNKYNLKCTFNLNSGLLNRESSFEYKGFKVKRLPSKGIKTIYAGHEIAIHGRTHINPPEIADEKQFEEEFLLDKICLEDMFEQKIVGAAYAYGRYDDRTIDYLNKIGIKYSRLASEKTDNFDTQTDLMRFVPTNHHDNAEVMENIDRFLAMENPEKPQIFYLWGHSYEFDGNKNWDFIEQVFKKVSNRDDIFYGTNKQVFEYYGLI